MGGLAVATSVSLIAGNTTANISLVVTLPRAHIVMNKRAHQLQLPVQLVHDAVYS